MKEPEWIAFEVILAIHEAQLAEHGGLPGVRDQGLLESAVAHPKNLFAYSERVTLNGLAAAYAVRLAKNAFLDGNKPTAWVVCAVFLELNGVAVTTSQSEASRIMEGSANGQVSEDEFTTWLNEQFPPVESFVTAN